MKEWMVVFSFILILSHSSDSSDSSDSSHSSHSSDSSDSFDSFDSLDKKKKKQGVPFFQEKRKEWGKVKVNLEIKKNWKLFFFYPFLKEINSNFILSFLRSFLLPSYYSVHNYNKKYNIENIKKE